MAKRNPSRSHTKSTSKTARKSDRKATKVSPPVVKAKSKPAKLTAPPAAKATPARVIAKPAAKPLAKPRPLPPVNRRSTPSLPKDSSRPADKPASKHRAAKPVVPIPEPVRVEAPPPRVKSPLSARELKEFKGLLLSKRVEIFGDASRMAENMNNRSGAGASEHSSMPIHMADLGSDNWEQELNLGLLASEQETVREIDNALRRIQDGTFGVCLATQKPIGLARLRAKPWARYCIEYARAREEGRA